MAIIALWLLAQQVVQRTHLALPAGILGLACMLALLFGGLLPTRYVEEGAEMLLGEMTLFFIPPLLSIISLWPLLMAQGFRLALALVLGCLSVMVCTALVVDRVFQLEQRRHAMEQSPNE